MVEFIKHNYETLIIIAAVILFVMLCFYLGSKRMRSKVIFYVSYALYKIGLKKRLSSYCLSRVHVKENYEHLVSLENHPKIIMNDDTVESPVLLRKKVVAKIFKIADELPDNLYIKIYSAYRSRIALSEKWNEELLRTQKENERIGRAELLSLVNSKVSSPRIKMGGHDTGGAIDLSLCDKNGNDIDFGTKYHEKRGDSNLTKEQRDNRNLLMKLMKSQGFVNYPGQWWHFSYGDKVWAAYKGKRLGALYGPAEKEFEKTGFVRIVKTDK